MRIGLATLVPICAALLAAKVISGLYVAPPTNMATTQAVGDLTARLAAIEGTAQTKSQIDTAIAAAMVGVDTISARTAAMTAALTGVDTVSARSAAVTSATSGLDTVAGRDAAISVATGALVSKVNSVTPVAGNVALGIGSISGVSNVSAFRRYSGVTLTLPALSAGSLGQGSIAQTGATPGDGCIVAPTSTATSLGVNIGLGWVTTAGTIRVQIVNPTLVGLSATTMAVNVLCVQ